MTRGGKSLVVAAALAMVFMALVALPASAQHAAEAAAPQAAAAPAPAQTPIGTIVIAVAVVVASSCLAAGYAVARVGSAALGAASERPELLGRSLILVGLAEGIAIYGLIVGIMLMNLATR